MSNLELALNYARRVWDERDLRAIDEILHSQCIIHSLIGKFYGPKAMKNVVQAWLDGFPDLKVVNTATSIEGNCVTLHWNAHGTHLGAFKGIEATHKPIAYTGSSTYRIENNEIVEYWGALDMHKLLAQITG